MKSFELQDYPESNYDAQFTKKFSYFISFKESVDLEYFYRVDWNTDENIFL